MTQEKNDELWAGVFPMWKKRVMLTQWSVQAWDDLYRTFDFAADVRKIGMLMTVDGTNDGLITVDGVEKYTFTDADSDDLPVNERSDDEDEEEEEEDLEEELEEEEEKEEEKGRGGGAGSLDDNDNDTEEGQEPPTHTFDDDSEDDTSDSQEVLSFVGAVQSPSGYKILESCPSVETEENMQELIGAQTLHAWDDKDRQGWFQYCCNCVE